MRVSSLAALVFCLISGWQPGVAWAGVSAQSSYELANQLFALGEYAKAVPEYQRAAGEEGMQVAAHCQFMLGRCFEQMSDWARAQQNYRLVWQLFARSKWARDAMLRVAEHVAVSPDPKELKRAESLCLKLVTLYPDSPGVAQAMCVLGEVRSRLGRFEAAIKNLQSVLEEHSGAALRARAHFALGRVLADQRYTGYNLDKAIEEFKKVIAEDPEGIFAPWAYFSIGNCLRRQKKWEHARRYFQTVVERYGGTLCAAAARPMLMLSQIEQDQFLRSTESFEQLLGLINKGKAPTKPHALVAKPAPRIMKLEVVANETYSDAQRAIYKGDVKVSAGRMRVFSDKVICELKRQVFRSIGRTTVQFADGFLLDCKGLEFDLARQRGIASGGVRYVEGKAGASRPGLARVRSARTVVFAIKDGRFVEVSVGQ